MINSFVKITVCSKHICNVILIFSFNFILFICLLNTFPIHFKLFMFTYLKIYMAMYMIIYAKLYPNSFQHVSITNLVTRPVNMSTM